MTTQAFTEEELDRMTPAEREAVKLDDDSDTVYQGGANDDGDDGDSAGAGADAGKAASDAAAAAAAKADDQTDVTDVVDKLAPYIAPEVENYDTRLGELETKKDEAFKKMMEGEITDAEYRTIEKETSAEIRRLDREVTKAEVSGEMTRQQAANSWLEYVGNQLESTKTAGADLTATPELMNELDRTVRLLAAQAAAEPDMVKHLAPTKPGALITNVDKWVLAESIKIVKARNNLGAAKPPEPKQQEKGRAPDLSGIPPSLAKVPVSMDPNTGGDEFAYLANLKGAEYERELAKLSPEQVARYTA